jgi:putative iron-regulated protein
LAAIEAIPEPFDQAFLGADTDPGRQAIAAALDALFTEADSIADAAAALGVSINLAP